MENTYKNMRELFEQLEKLDILEKTKNNEDLKMDIKKHHRWIWIC